MPLSEAPPPPLPASPIPRAPADGLGSLTLAKEMPVTAVGDLPAATPALIAKGFPRCQEPAKWADAFNAAFARVGSFNRLGMACILAKANTEAMGLTRWDEDMFYTTRDQVLRMHGARALVSAAAKADYAAYREAVKAGRTPPLPNSVQAEVTPLLRNPKALGDRVYSAWGGFDARGLGVIQNTTLANHQAFANDMGMTLAEARAFMQTIPGAALMAPWYVRKFGGQAAANRGDMKAVMACVAGKTVAGMAGIWVSVHGEKQMADYELFRRLLGA